MSASLPWGPTRDDSRPTFQFGSSDTDTSLLACAISVAFNPSQRGGINKRLHHHWMDHIGVNRAGRNHITPRAGMTENKATDRPGVPRAVTPPGSISLFLIHPRFRDPKTVGVM